MDGLLELIHENYNINVKKGQKIKNVYRLYDDEKSWCFKFSKYGINEYSFIIKAIEHILNTGFENIIPPYKTNSGKVFIPYENGFGYLCDWVDSREADFKNPVELKLCVSTLSEMHIISRGFEMDKTPGIRNYYGKWIKRFKKRCDELVYFKTLIAAKDKLRDFDNLYLKHFDFHYRQGLKAIRNLEKSCYLDIVERDKKLSEICHHDTANHNFLITEDMNVYMVDFDYCIRDTHLHDLGSIIIRNLKYGNWNFETLDFILEVYSKNVPVSDEEIYLICCFMEFPQDYWQVGLQYYVEEQKWTEEFFVKKLSRIIEDSKARFQFIENMETRYGRVLHGH